MSPAEGLEIKPEAKELNIYDLTWTLLICALPVSAIPPNFYLEHFQLYIKYSLVLGPLSYVVLVDGCYSSKFLQSSARRFLLEMSEEQGSAPD